MGLNRLDDIEVSINSSALKRTDYHYNHFDHGCWNDIVQFDVPASVLHQGENVIAIKRLNENPDFAGAVEVRKCILELTYPDSIAPGNV